MVGVIPAIVQMKDRLAALGYREVQAVSDTLLLQKGETARGHEFHYSTLTAQTDDYPYAYETAGRRGKQREGFVQGQILAGYTHLHFASNPEMVKRWIQACKSYQQTRSGEIG
jgi:cobyrinic acid a,c-diamide synthase